MLKRHKDRWFTWASCLTVVFALAGVAGADHYPPDNYQDPDWAPQWFKDCTGFKTWADWSFEFDTDPPNGPYLSDNDGWNWNIPDRQPPYVELTGNAAWQNAFQMRQGVVGGFGDLDFHVWMDNQEADLLKQVWFQFDAWVPVDFWGFVEDGLSLSYPGTDYVLPLEYGVGDPDNYGWRVVTAYWEIPQPEWEQVDFQFNLGDTQFYVDSMRMATQCVPGPGAAMLLALAGLGLRRRRR